MADSHSAADPHPRKSVDLLGSTVRYVDTGSGEPVVLIHGNPTSSYLWRNVIPELAGNFRCLAPDLIGMGDSGKNPSGEYTFAEHSTFIDAWLDAVLPEGRLRFVVHDWGGALGFHWAARHPERVAGIAYMETVVCPVRWADWPEQARGIFQGFRSPKGEDLILNRNLFIEGVLPNAVMRDLTDEEMAAYRKPFAEGGEVRRPMLTWPRQIPIDGEPPEVVAVVEAYGTAMKASPIPKLFINARPGSILTGPARDFCRSWANQEEVTVKGLHFVQEDSPAEIGAACNDFFSRHAG
ncbi:MAG: haloalkane dehalogenase [Rhodospirillaceae bacterium]|nr:haloalkane dehalogenase [Rhodospirillaceae bacterium]MYH37826.1 haloalkane dehalogenase [Rhodospirillaceae bacterium]MYK14984.1 haloalkane dehalogenase [Rhodospirillaceae bacterium]MYK59542.1 haloalkane dehalogenase [Rhodospirillaceae bacterium]